MPPTQTASQKKLITIDFAL